MTVLSASLSTKPKPLCLYKIEKPVRQTLTDLSIQIKRSCFYPQFKFEPTLLSYYTVLFKICKKNST